MMMRCAIVTNIPTPYRNPVFAALPPEDFTVIFCARTEGNRQWRLAEPSFPHEFLSERVSAKPDGYNFVHNNPDIWATLNRLQPEVVVCSGINPTHLYAFAWTRAHRAQYVYMTDGTEQSEAEISWKHRLVRRFIIAGSSAGIVASVSGRRLLNSYGMPVDRIFFSRLCADNLRFRPAALENRPFDVMFCGQLHERKLPELFVSTCVELKRRRGSCRALVIGDGPERTTVLNALTDAGVEVTYPGFIQPNELAGWYSRARLLLFTTRMDPWGVVANEAMAAGTPVITTPFAGVAGDLVIDGVNGRIAVPVPTAWADACQSLLDDDVQWLAFSIQALAHVQSFNYQSAASGIVDACHCAAAA